jgi:hypothetical protein
MTGGAPGGRMGGPRKRTRSSNFISALHDIDEETYDQ